MGEGLSGSVLAPTVTTDGTTTFQDNATVNVQAVATATEQNLVKGLLPFDTNSIKDFLAKPIQIASLSYTTTTTAGTQLYTTDVMRPLATNKLWANKLWGYEYIRATAVFRVQVAAEPFQGGLLRLCFLPCPALHENGSSNAYKSAHTFSIMQLSVLPGIDLDVHDTAAELRVPFVSPYAYTDLPSLYNVPASGSLDWMTSSGRFYLFAYCPSLGVNTTVPVKVYLHYEDVELAAPNYTGESARPSGKIIRKEMESDSPVQSTLSKFGRAVNYFVSPPSIQAITEGALGLAKAFGYSKPQSLSHPIPIIPNAMIYAGNSDGVINSDVLGINPGTNLAPASNLMGSSADEMSFAYIKKIPAYFAGIPWSNSTGANTEIYTLQNSPPNYYTQWSLGANSGFSQPPFGYITDCFQLWRGSIEVTFKFVKSPLAIGTLAIEFYPDATSTTGLLNSNYVLREIIDLRNQNEIKLVLPWSQNLSWIKNSSFNGKFVLRVINPLVLASAAGTNISIMMFVNAGDDYDVAVPYRDVNRMPYAGESDNSALPMVAKVIGSGMDLPTTPDANMMTIGDPFTSVKQLLTMSTRTIFPTGVSNSGFLSGDLSANAYMYTSGSLVATTAGLGFLGDWLSVLSCGFAFQRGSTRIIASPGNNTAIISKAYLLAITSTPALAKTTIGPAPNLPLINAGLTGAAINPLASTNMIALRNGTGNVDVRIPNYRMTPFGPAKYYGPSELWYMPTGSSTANSSQPCLATLINSSAAIAEIYRSAGDDFTLGYFVGFPPILITST